MTRRRTTYLGPDGLHIEWSNVNLAYFVMRDREVLHIRNDLEEAFEDMRDLAGPGWQEATR